jgi:hypothetical protein
MIDKEAVLRCTEEPMDLYKEEMCRILDDWRPLLASSELLLDGKAVNCDELPSVLQPLMKMMQLIMELTRDSEWSWSHPEVQKVFGKKAESPFYQVLTNVIVRTITAIVKTITVGTLVEVGTGPGKIAERLCKEFAANNIDIPIIISDKEQLVFRTGAALRKSFPTFTIRDFVWDAREDPPDELTVVLRRPVLLFSRLSLPYAGYGAIDRISPIADIYVMQEDLNLTGKKEAYDVIYEKIGAAFFTYETALGYLQKHFSFIHMCDKKTIQALHFPSTTFTLAIK